MSCSGEAPDPTEPPRVRPFYPDHATVGGYLYGGAVISPEAIARETERVRLTNPIVNRAIQLGAPTPLIVVALADENERLREVIKQMDTITPKKYQIDGKIVIWYPPESMLEVSVLAGSKK